MVQYGPILHLYFFKPILNVYYSVLTEIDD